MSGAETVYLVDQVVVKPGQGEAFLNAYRERYVPGAQARGMRLEKTWVSPPMWLDDQSNTLLFIWSLQGAQGFWAMSFQGRQDPSLQQWWHEEAASMIESRQRYLASDVVDLTTLNTR
jgi:hypothetical protein